MLPCASSWASSNETWHVRNCSDGIGSFGLSSREAPKGLVERLNKSRRYRLTSEGYRICVVYLKLFERIYAPLASAILKPFKPDSHLQTPSLLDRLYRTV